MGGLGIRRVSSLAIPAFLASAVGTLALQSDILRQLEGNQDPSVEELEARWRIESGITIPNSFPTHIQSKWDQLLLHRILFRAIHHAFRENRPGQIECSVYSTCW